MKIFDFFKKKKRKATIDTIETDKIKYCEKCGNPITLNYSFCKKCGNLINSDLIKLPENENILNDDSLYNYKNEENPIFSDIMVEDNANKERNLYFVQNKELNKELKISSNNYTTVLEEEFTSIINNDYTKENTYNTNDDITEILSDLIKNDGNNVIDKIIEFVVKNVDPGVYYSVIYGKFKKDLELFNINSFMEVKKEIDRYIPQNYIKTEKFISVYASEEEIKKRIIDIAKNINSRFRIFELSKSVPGIQWPILEKIIFEAERQKIFVQVDVDNSNYPFYEYREPEEVDIDEELKKILLDETDKEDKQNENELYEELYEFIIKLLEEVDCEMISLNIVCSQLRMFNKELFEKLKLGKDIDKLSKIIKNNLNGRLYVNKPFVAKCPIRNSVDVTCDYLRTLNEFDKKEMDDFQSKIGLVSHKSYEVFIDKMNDDFIRVDVTRMIKKEIFNISSDDLNSISKNLIFYFKNNNVLDTSKFKAYAMLPNLGKYKWNKYLLIGVIKTYFGDVYKIEKYGKTINDMNYIIRRENDEL